jgi:GSH-dependent disulfide-bond oxidoreductase
MIDFYFAPTPNGLKLRLFLEEAQIPYRAIRVFLSKGEQFRPEFLAISPNNKIPAIIDHEPRDGGAPLPMFESGAIMLYLAEKTGRLIPTDLRGRAEVLQWLFWQVSGLGPMAGQIEHFNVYAKERVPYAIERYTRETRRLFSVLDRRLAGREFVAGEFSLADIACYTWIVPYAILGQKLEEFPNLARWFATIRARPATIRTYADVDDGHAHAPAAAA